MLPLLITFGVIAVAGLLLMHQASISVWVIVISILSLLDIQYNSPGVLHLIFLSVFVGLMLLFAIRPLRLNLLSKPLLPFIKRFMPTMSDTEREALEAGSIGWEADLFTGDPDFEKLHNAPRTVLTEEEQEFLDGPVNTLCSMVNDWDISHNLADLSPKTWQFIKDNGFFSFIIPKEYGGKEFSSIAQMHILAKLYSCSPSLASTVAVPNSLGPAELLLKYGTDSQKKYYLPRLAEGKEIPCFALTGPNAGSDAASIPDTGYVCYENIDGKRILGLKLNWNKRYITLAPIATIIGLAFRLFDPDNILGKGTDIGITCALIPADTKGITKGRRHFPLNSVFQNGPTQGKDVFLPMDGIIGGVEMAGHGWRMLMECLSAGRAISLPSTALGGIATCAVASGAYTRIRKQFSQPIYKFEGIAEPLGRMAGNAYLIHAALNMTISAIDNGTKSAVAGAILKYHATELARMSGSDAMDIHGGKGICLGPNNYLGRAYEAIPIGITVEGANILTRNLIIFGQGVIRCHPYVLSELESIRNNDNVAFDKALWGHVGFALSNLIKSIVYSFTNSRFVSVNVKENKRSYKLLKTYSSQLAFIADFCMFVLGSQLKRKESISARLGDVLSSLYLVSGVLQQAHKDGNTSDDLPFVNWCCYQLFYDCEIALRGVIGNFPKRWGRIFLKLVLQPFGNRRTKPRDKIHRVLANIVARPNEIRERLKKFIFVESIENCPIGKMEAAFIKICAAEDLERKVTIAFKNKTIKALDPLEQIIEAHEKGILSAEEANILREAENARQEVIAVDDFSPEELIRSSTHVKESKDIKDIRNVTNTEHNDNDIKKNADKISIIAG